MYIKIIAPPKYYHPEDIQFMQFFCELFLCYQYSVFITFKHNNKGKCKKR